MQIKLLKSCYIFLAFLFSQQLLNAADLVLITAVSNTVNVNGNLTYSFLVANNGPETAVNVRLSGSIPYTSTFVSFKGPEGWSAPTPAPGVLNASFIATIASLPPGARHILTLIVNVTGMAAGTILNGRFVVSDDTPNPHLSPSSSDVYPTIAAVPVLLNVAQAIPQPSAPLPADNNLMYLIQVTNMGADPLSGVSLTNTLIPGLTFVSLTPAEGWQATTPPVGSSGMVTAYTPVLIPGQTSVFVLTVKPGVAVIGTTMRNETLVKSDSPGSTSTSSTDVPIDVPHPTPVELIVQKTGPANVSAGKEATYTVKIINLGTSPSSQVAMVDSLQSGSTFVSNSLIPGSAMSFPPVGQTGVVTASIPSIGARSFVICSIVVKVADTLSAGTLSNAAYVTSASPQLYLSNDTAVTTAVVDTRAVQKSAGLNYKYYEGDFDRLPDFNMLTPIKTGVTANADISVRPAGVNDRFAFLWEGTISLPSAGDYTFETISDDGSKLFLNGSLLVNNDGLHPMLSASGSISVPSSGKYPISISFFENSGDQNIQVYWSGPGFARQLIPDSVFFHEPLSSLPQYTGLNYKYYEGNFDKLPDFHTLIPVKTGTSANIDLSVRPTGVNDRFAFVWEGTIHIPQAGDYTFETISDDGSKFYFNGNLLVNNDGLHPSLSASGKITIPAAGYYPVVISFFENSGDENMQLFWTGPGLTRQQVPDAAFYTKMPAANVAVMDSKAGDVTQATNKNSEVPVTGRIYPNPFSQTFTIEYFNSTNDKHTISVGIYDLNGKLLVDFKPSALVPGYNRWPVNVSNSRLAAGIYFVKLSIDGMPAAITKLVKIK